MQGWNRMEIICCIICPSIIKRKCTNQTKSIINHSSFSHLFFCGRGFAKADTSIQSRLLIINIYQGSHYHIVLVSSIQDQLHFYPISFVRMMPHDVVCFVAFVQTTANYLRGLKSYVMCVQTQVITFGSGHNIHITIVARLHSQKVWSSHGKQKTAITT